MKLPAMTLRCAAVVPPIRLPPELLIDTPLPPFADAARPAMFVPR